MSPSREYRAFVGRDVVVEMGDYSVRGTLVDAPGEVLVLDDEVTVTPTGGEPVPADGQLVIERARVLWVQVV